MLVFRFNLVSHNPCFAFFCAGVFFLLLSNQTSAQKKLEGNAESQSDRNAKTKKETQSPKKISIDKTLLNELINRLGSRDFAIRASAHKKILELGEGVLPIVSTIETDDIEVKWRLRDIQKSLTIDPLTGTVWRLTTKPVPGGKINLGPQTISFLADNLFESNKTGNSAKEEWEPNLEGRKVRFHFNNKYATYEGIRISPNKMQGSATNIKGKKWLWTAERKR